MRCALIALVVIVPICAFARERKLDTSKRAQSDETVKLPATETEFRNMQRRYRSSDYAKYRKKLLLLHAGMTEKEVMDALGPTKVTFPATSNDVYLEFIVLNDAYFAAAAFDKRKRLLYLSGPNAVIYETKAVHKNPPRT